MALFLRSSRPAGSPGAAALDGRREMLRVLLGGVGVGLALAEAIEDRRVVLFDSAAGATGDGFLEPDAPVAAGVALVVGVAVVASMAGVLVAPPSTLVA